MKTKDCLIQLQFNLSQSQAQTKLAQTSFEYNFQTRFCIEHGAMDIDISFAFKECEIPLYSLIGIFFSKLDQKRCGSPKAIGTREGEEKTFIHQQCK